jgi:F-type H+-transporting ATPase subunit epsilon
MPLHLIITTPQGIAYQGEVAYVQLQTESGPIGVYPKHRAVVSALRPGVSTILHDGKEQFLATGTGYVEILHDTVTVLTEIAVPAADITADEADQARAKAEELRLQRHQQEDVDMTKLQADIEKEIAKVHAYTKQNPRTGA